MGEYIFVLFHVYPVCVWYGGKKWLDEFWFRVYTSIWFVSWHEENMWLLELFHVYTSGCAIIHLVVFCYHGMREQHKWLNSSVILRLSCTWYIVYTYRVPGIWFGFRYVRGGKWLLELFHVYVYTRIRFALWYGGKNGYFELLISDIAVMYYLCTFSERAKKVDEWIRIPNCACVM